MANSLHSFAAEHSRSADPQKMFALIGSSAIDVDQPP
jgi:hypothetical protein